MTYHITKIVNNSPKSVSLTNPVSPGDSSLTPALQSSTPKEAILVRKYDGSAADTYKQTVKSHLNIYTQKNNYCFWDDGESALRGIGENDTSDRLLFEGDGGKLTLFVKDDGSIYAEASN